MDTPIASAELLATLLPAIQYASRAYQDEGAFVGMAEIKDTILVEGGHPLIPGGLFGNILETNTQLHVAIRDSDTLVLAFRGTEFPRNGLRLPSAKQLIAFTKDAFTDVWFGMEPVEWWPSGPNDPPKLAHTGWLAALNDVIQQPRGKVGLVAASKKLFPGRTPAKVIVCGHSLGGAIATVCAAWVRTVLYKSKSIEVNCITIGSPRVGNQAFRDAFKTAFTDAKGLHSWRIVHNYDPVPCVPNIDDMHMGTVLFGMSNFEQFHHVAQSVWLERGAGHIYTAHKVDRHDLLADEEATKVTLLGWLKFFWGIAPRWWHILDHDNDRYVAAVTQILTRFKEQNPTNAAASIVPTTDPQKLWGLLHGEDKIQWRHQAAVFAHEE